MTRSFPIASALAAAAASLLLAGPAAAGHAVNSVRPDPADAKASVPQVAYRSAFSDYRPLADGKLGWKQANDQVGRIGGWRGYAREAGAPDTPASGPDAGAHGTHGHDHKH